MPDLILELLTLQVHGDVGILGVELGLLGGLELLEPQEGPEPVSLSDLPEKADGLPRQTTEKLRQPPIGPEVPEVELVPLVEC